MLHVLNGDALAGAFGRGGVPGEVAVCRDMLSEGPVPAGLATEADWRRRASELESRYDIAPADYLARSAVLRDALAAGAKHDEVALWFEQDLFCLVNLAWCLQALAAAPPPRLSLVFPPPPLGARQDDRLGALWAQRADARPLLEPARRFWAAYAAPDPRGLLGLRDPAGAPGLPWQAEGVAAHLARFPAPDTGLSHAEAALLRTLRAEGPLLFGELYQRVAEDPGVRALGAGDSALAAVLRDLAAGPRPLVFLENAPEPRRLDMAAVMSWEAEVAPRGEAVLRGEADAVRERGLDRWLGGVHLEVPAGAPSPAGPGGRRARAPAPRAATTWRWDPGASTLVQA